MIAKPMSDRRRILLLILILTGCVMLSGGTAIALLYHTAFQEETAKLSEMARGQARLVEALASHARQDAEVAQKIIEAAMAHFTGAHPSSDLRFARREADAIVYVAVRPDMAAPQRLPLDTPLAVPMRRALSGESGTCVGPDLRGVTVLAAFEPIAGLGWGVVAKTDLAEVRQPFIVAGLLAGAAACLLISGGAWWFTRITQPMLDHLRDSEESVRTLNNSLEQRITARTVELEAANRELEAFSYSVSHDLRSPLRAIAGFSTALEDDSRDRLDATGVRYLTVIRRETERMGELIDDLLRLSHLTRNPLTRQEVDLTALATEVASDLRQRHPGREVVLTIQPGLQVNADRGMMRIALQNLLANAWKFTARQQQAHIQVLALADGRPGFVITDDGVGFDMAYADRLFGAFQRLHDRAEFPGTGIGLATVARIARRHGGSVRAEAIVDHGATFFITIP